ncbi:MAG: hypothetical protein MRZ93_11335 [Lachnospiraceae bacterium]|nr:hypothetical protein [Lachnospiraceae bacterium]
MHKNAQGTPQLICVEEETSGFMYSCLPYNIYVRMDGEMVCPQAFGVDSSVLPVDCGK